MRPLYYGVFAFARLFGGKAPGGSARQILPCTAPHQSSSLHAGRNVLRSGHMAAPFWRRVFGLENRQKQEERLCAPPQTVEKPLILGRAAFLAPFRRSQRSQEMLRHKALGLCPKPRQGPEAPAPRTLSAACLLVPNQRYSISSRLGPVEIM